MMPRHPACCCQPEVVRNGAAGKIPNRVRNPSVLLRSFAGFFASPKHICGFSSRQSGFNPVSAMFPGALNRHRTLRVPLNAG
jgi:hypothetical protein